MDKIVKHIASVTNEVMGRNTQVAMRSSAWNGRYVYRPTEENDGSFRRDKSGHAIVLMVAALFLITWFVTR